MKTVTVFWGVLVALAVSGAPADLRAQSVTPCGCTEQDKLDLKSRVQLTEAAMQELDRMIKFWQGRNGGSMTLEDGGNQHGISHEAFRDGVLMQELRFRVVPAVIKGARTYGAETDPACDVIIPPAATACLRGALQDHENVHAKACKANKSPNPFADWRSDQKIVDYLKEEREGYQKENERLKREQDSQNKQCQPTKLDPSAQQQLQKYLNLILQTNQSHARLQTYGASLIDKYLTTPPTVGGGK